MSGVIRSEDQFLKEVLDPFMDEVADFIFTRSQEHIVENESINSGHMLNSANVERNFLEKRIVYSAPYAVHVEYGTDPHMPPVEPLIEWARSKLGKTDKEARKTGWAIAKKIARDGTDPKPFIRPALEDAVAKYGRRKGVA